MHGQPQPKDLALPDDLRQAVGFHGHLCPGLVIGYLASRAALERLSAGRSEDEELVAIVENDACGVDAVQWLTGCTFGKGNLVFRDFGKQVFTFALRPSGRAVRVGYRSEPAPENERDPDASDEVRRRRQVAFMLERGAALLDVRECVIDLPDRARIRESAACDACGERVMETRLREVSGRRLCIPCAEAAPER